MTLERKILKGVSWLAIFQSLSQLASWIITVLVARILVPRDYALMEMATIITGYAAIINELGLGSAIVQRKSYSLEEYSSVFWFTLLFSTILAVACLILAYPTASIFDEPSLIPLTQSTSILFLLTGLQIVPMNIQKKRMDFKSIGLILMISVFVSSISMYFMALSGWGVWTLIGGNIVKALTKLVLTYYIVDWWPTLHFRYKELKPYLRFGVTLAGGRSLNYLFQKSDRFFAGRAWKPTMLGHYTFALSLAQLPTEKIISIINQVSFPAFSEVQDNLKKLKILYLSTVKMAATIVVPLFVGGFLIGEDLIKLILNDKWYPMIPVFKYFCLVQIIQSLNAFNHSIHSALGRPDRSLKYNLLLAIMMPIGFYFTVPYGLNYILIPWFVIWGGVSIFWIVFTIGKVEVPLKTYLKNLKVPAISTLFMFCSILILEYVFNTYFYATETNILRFSAKLLIGILSYLSSIWYLDKEMLKMLKKLKS